MPGPPSDWDPEVDRMDYGEAECSVTLRAWQDDKTEEEEPENGVVSSPAPADA